MPKINREEYEVLKELDNKWKWIARDYPTDLFVYKERPKRFEGTQTWDDLKDNCMCLENDLFQFIQWEDEEPYSIAELIKEYEIKELRLAPSGTVNVDSFDGNEETEVKKDLKWFKKELDDIENNTPALHRHDAIWMLDRVHELYNQLDEPEVLSQEWIDEHEKREHLTGPFGNVYLQHVVPSRHLQNLLVPKQELPVIPKFVAEYLDFAKSDTTLMRVLELANTRNEWGKWEKEYDWIEENHELFARAWLDGYTVEEEQRYYAKLKEIQPLEKEWLTNLSGPYYYAIDTKGLMLGEFILDLVGMKTEASTHTLKDWERHGINDSNADFIKVEEMEE